MAQGGDFDFAKTGAFMREMEPRPDFPAGKDKTYAIGSCNFCHTNEGTCWYANVMNGG